MHMFYEGTGKVIVHRKAHGNPRARRSFRNGTRFGRACLSVAVVAGLLATPLKSYAAPIATAVPTVVRTTAPTPRPITTVIPAPPTVIPITTLPPAFTVTPIVTAVPRTPTAVPAPAVTCVETTAVATPLAPATALDVFQCTVVAEALAMLAWYGGAIMIESIGSAANVGNAKIMDLLMKATGKNKNFVTGLEMIIGALGYKVMPKAWLTMTLEQFFESIVKPIWAPCQRIGADLGSLPT